MKNAIVHLWKFDDDADRRAHWAALFADGRVPAGCGYCFGTSPKASERGQSAGHHHAKRIFTTPSLSLGLYLSTLSPPTLLNRHPVLGYLWLWPRWHPIQQDFFQRPHMIGQASRHRRGTRPPPLGCATTVRDFGSRQRLAKARVGQDEVVIDVKQRQLISHARFALAERVDPAPDRRHPLTDIEVEAVTVGRRVTPSTTAPKRRMKLSPHAAPQYLDACHADLAGGSLGAPAFSHYGSVHEALADSQSAHRGACH